MANRPKLPGDPPKSRRKKSRRRKSIEMNSLANLTAAIINLIVRFIPGA